MAQIKQSSRTNTPPPPQVDESWEDLSDPEEDDRTRKIPRRRPLTGPLTPGRSARPHTPLRNRKQVRRFNAVTSPRNQTTLPLSPTPTPPSARLATSQEIQILNEAGDGIKFIAVYTRDVFRTAIHLLRRPLAVILFLYLLALLLNRLWATFRVAFDPLCRIPGISRLEICMPLERHDPRGPAQWADYPSLVRVQSKTFEQLLEESSASTGLTLEIKKAEMATTDLINVVVHSKLASRNVLADMLKEFVDDAKVTGKGLHKLHAKVGGSVDEIMAVNEYALEAISAAEDSVPRPRSFAALNPWAPTRSSTRAVITKTFHEAMTTLSSNLHRLVLEAETSLSNLNTLEEKLHTLHGILKREDSSLTDVKEEILASLWTFLGGNRKELKGIDTHLVILKELDNYRKKARAHVVGALQTLEELSGGIEDMRERVTRPALGLGSGDGEEIPVHVHVKSIQMGLARLKDGRSRAKEIERAVIRNVLGDGDTEII